MEPAKAQDTTSLPGVSATESLRALTVGRTPDASLFPNEPCLSHFQKISFDDVRARIANSTPDGRTDVSTIWGTPSFSQIAERAAFRPDKGEFRGTQTDGNDRMPYVGYWLSSPGVNRTYLLQDSSVQIDRTLVDWFQRAGIGGETVLVANAADLKQKLTSSGRRVYTCDNYGPALDGLSVNSREDFDLVSNKAWTTRLVGSYAPYEERIDMFRVEATPELFERVRGDSQTIYVKLCNDEHGGMGVKPVRDLDALKALMEEHRKHTREHNLNPELVLQRGAEGMSRSFCFFIDRNDPNIPILSVTDQMVDEATGRDLGNRHYPITPDVVRPLTGMISELRTNILKYCPNAFGLVMCDFIHGKNDQVVAIDPGLRPSASTPSAMAQLWTSHRNGETSYVRNNQCFRFSPGFSWADFTKRIGHLADPEVIKNTGVGVVPFSWEPAYGTGRVITIAKSQKQHDELSADLRRLCGAAYLS